MLDEKEIDLLCAVLCFAHLNRQQFGDYVRYQGNQNTQDYFESIDHNALRQKVSDLLPDDEY